MNLFLIKKIFIAIVLPPTGPLIVALTGLCLLKAKPKLGRALTWVGFSVLLTLSLPIVADVLQRFVYNSPPLDLKQAASAQAVVILGGGVRRHAPEFGGDTLGRLTLDRVRYGALVARQTHLPVLVTGGVVFHGDPEAVLMKRSLEDEFNIKVRWAEASSRNTHENAVKSAEMLLPSGVRRVVLVGHSFDMPRATAEFNAAGLDVIAAPTHLPSGTIDTPLDFMPSVSALQSSYYAIYEILGNTARKIGI